MGSNKVTSPQLLVALGFILVAVGILMASPIPLSFGTVSGVTGEHFYWIACGLGDLLFGAGLWIWLDQPPRTTGGSGRFRLACRLFSVACLVLGVAYVGLLNELLTLHDHLRYHWGLRRQGLFDIVSMAGFCLAAVGLWIAGMAPRPHEARQEDEAHEPAR